MAPQPVSRKELLDLAVSLHAALALHVNDFDEPEYSIMDATLHAQSDTIHELVADELHDSAQKISKITDAIQIQTKKLKDLKDNLAALQNFAGQAAEVINAATQFLPYLR